MTTQVFKWSGTHEFRVTGTELHEDTLRIKGGPVKSERPMKLVLPTLCITYADLKFQNDIGGKQKNYPDAAAYAGYFSPAVELTGKDIEKYTYIRGAQRVKIGKTNTTIEFWSRKDLVIPRLWISHIKPSTLKLTVPEAYIDIKTPLTVEILQYANGRHIGGVRMDKPHPDWKPEEAKPLYDLSVRVIDGQTLAVIPEMQVFVWHWDENMRTPYGRGGFHLDETLYTNGQGAVQLPHRPAGELEAVTVFRPGKRIVARCFRPLSGQKVNLTMKAWDLTRDNIRYTWKPEDRLDLLSQITGHGSGTILAANGLKHESQLHAGSTITLPCHAATYRLESWDQLDRIAGEFGYKNALGLAKVNGLTKAADVDNSIDIKLPDWKFVYAPKNVLLEEINKLFGLPEGSARPVGKVYRPNAEIPHGFETVAIPSPRFSRHKLPPPGISQKLVPRKTRIRKIRTAAARKSIRRRK